VWRVALGASRSEVFRLVIGHGMSLTSNGATGRRSGSSVRDAAVGGVLPSVTGADPVAYVGVVARLAASAFVASYLPARRATRVDPIVALRAD
jgi:ABC-type antimicrobial peptide transport system permease subunit